MTFKFIDLFCGIGGFRIGFEKNDFSFDATLFDLPSSTLSTHESNREMPETGIFGSAHRERSNVALASTNEELRNASNAFDAPNYNEESIISDGGIKFSGDIAKALAAGADAIMMGSIFAGTDESPGKKFKIKGKIYKSYRGMGSIGAMSSGSANRYFQKKFKDKSKFVPEGVEGRVAYKGNISKIIYQLKGGLRSSMGYIGAKNLGQISKNAEFIKITKAGFYESMVHSVEITQKTINYKL